MFCHNCGRQLPDNARFCPGCGTDLYAAWNAAPGAKSAPPPPPAPAPEPAWDDAQPAEKPANKLYQRVLHWLLLLAVAAILVWAWWPEPIGSKNNSELGVDFLKALQEAHIGFEPDTLVIIDDDVLPKAFEGEQLPDIQTQLDTAIRNMEEHILVVSYEDLISFDTMGQAFAYPYFWVSPGGIASSDLQWVSWQKTMSFFRTYTLEYSVDPDDLDPMQAQIDAAVEEYLSLIPADADEWQAAKIVHDEMVRRISYDHSMSQPHRGDIYGGLVENSAVCSGYTYTFSYLMMAWSERAGLEHYTTGTEYWDEHFGKNSYLAVMSEDHGWNRIYSIDTPDGNLDVTWDDLDMTDKNGRPYILYDYFGLSTAEISLVDSHIESGSRLFALATGGDFGEPFNYHKHEGCYLTAFDLDAITSVFAQQYAAGSNVLTVRFAELADFARIETWTGDNAQECQQLLASIGCSGSYVCVSTDELLTFNILLDYPET